MPVRVCAHVQKAVPPTVAAKGNARAVRNLVDAVLRRQTDRHAHALMHARARARTMRGYAYGCRVADANNGLGTQSFASLMTLEERDFLDGTEQARHCYAAVYVGVWM